MSARVKIRPSKENKSAKTPHGRARTQGGKERDVSTGQFPKATGRKPARTHEPVVQAHIRVFGVYLNQNTRTSIRRKLDRKFRKFAGSIERMSVRLKDVNGPRGGVDHVCRIKVVLRNLPSVVCEKKDVSPDVAFGGALAGAERAVRRALQRRRNKPIRKRPRIAPVPLTKSSKES
jgi:Sigma 54 modulation protein / S30EA ribosomal protein